MAESKGTMLAKSVQKHAGRAKEKILQNLGKVDRTADEIFDDHLNNFNRQQQNANRLQKEFNNYIRCIRAAQIASKSLMDAIFEIYEPQWSGYDALSAQVQSSESLWQDFSHKLADQVLIPLNTYTGQFPEMKKKVEKRNRKLIDYDGQRHSFQSLQANANKRKDDVKLTKGREQLEEARRTYELLNTELHDELPALYESRILFLVTNLQTLFATEQVFHNETAKIYSELEAIVDKLATESQRGSNTLRKVTSNAIKASSPVQSPVKQMNDANISNSIQYQNTNGSTNPPSPSTSSTQEPRLDNVSPTPETSALGAAASASPAATVAPATSGSSTPGSPTGGAVAMRTSMGNLVNDATAVDSTSSPVPPMPQSPNANVNAMPELVARRSINNEEKASEVTSTTTTTTTTTKDFDKDMNNAISTTITKTTEMTHVTKAEGGQFNGTNNNNGELPQATMANTNGNANESDLTTSLPARGTKTTSNGNANAIHHHTSSSTGGSTVGPDDSNKKALGGNNLLITHDNDVHRNSNSKVVEQSKNPFEDDDDEQIYDIPKDATTTDLPPGVLYRVKATYGYVKEDVDELSFEVGDIIRVIEYDDPEDQFFISNLQEEGWLMGEKEGTNEKGLFPANFTRPI
ncbi:amphiphysin isoform X2 [Haematobia irritans]|uniref:amphiphysin isoform X2 n=1 Tax=Haematobia irritans TaxID=7368 RepID=UPI003F5074DE